MTTVTFLPSKAGDNTEFVSQIPASGAHWDKCIVAGDDRYIADHWSTEGVWHCDLFGYDAVVRGGKINSVTIYMTVKAVADDPSWFKSAIKTHGSIYYGAEHDMWGLVPWQNYSDAWVLNPYTSSLWSWSEIYELQFGIAHKGRYGDGDFVSMTIDYTVENVKPGLIDMGMM